MEDGDLQQLVLHLAGPARDRTRLARLLNISDSTAYGWIALSEEGDLRLSTSVRGDANRIAKNALVEALEGLESGALPREDLEAFLRARTAGGTVPSGPSGTSTDSGSDRELLERGLTYAQAQLARGASIESVIASIETIIAVMRGGR